MSESTLKIEHVRAAVKELRACEKRLGDLATMLEARLEGSETAGEQHKRVTAAFVDEWSRAYGMDYVFAGGKDGMAVKRLLKVLEADEIIRRIGVYVRSQDPFFKRSRHSLALFASTINQHAGGQAELLPIPVGCSHAPPCKDDIEHTRRARAEVLR